MPQNLSAKTSNTSSTDWWRQTAPKRKSLLEETLVQLSFTLCLDGVKLQLSWACLKLETVAWLQPAVTYEGTWGAQCAPSNFNPFLDPWPTHRHEKALFAAKSFACQKRWLRTRRYLCNLWRLVFTLSTFPTQCR